MCKSRHTQVEERRLRQRTSDFDNNFANETCPVLLQNMPFIQSCTIAVSLIPAEFVR